MYTLRYGVCPARYGNTGPMFFIHLKVIDRPIPTLHVCNLSIRVMSWYHQLVHLAPNIARQNCSTPRVAKYHIISVTTHSITMKRWPPSESKRQQSSIPRRQQIVRYLKGIFMRKRRCVLNNFPSRGPRLSHEYPVLAKVDGRAHPRA